MCSNESDATPQKCLTSERQGGRILMQDMAMLWALDNADCKQVPVLCWCDQVTDQTNSKREKCIRVPLGGVLGKSGPSIIFILKVPSS